MQWISQSQVLIVGLGLMGGSYAMGLKRLGYHVSAIDVRKEAIDYALDKGIIDKGYTKADASILKQADAVIFGLYPTTLLDWMQEWKDCFKPGALLTDVTGVKMPVVYDIQAMLPDTVEFIAAHPMAGKEVYGVENADPAIFRQANYIVVPTENNTQRAIKWCEDLGRVLGFQTISSLSPEEHDKMIGFVSQLTHCIAVSLMTCAENTHLVDYTGDSFRDLTRIARINDQMWSELFMLNKSALLEEMDRFLEEFTLFRDLLAEGDVEGIREKMRLSTKRRALFDKK
jgi:prephenate dehydrogenase